MRNISLLFKQFSRTVLLIAGLTALSFAAQAQGDKAKGEALFKAKCSACHKLDIRVTGPALGALMTSETDDKWLTKWIQNNQALIAAKDPKALKIYNEYNQAGMTVFTELSDGDVANIITYVREEWKVMQEQPKGGGGDSVAADSGPSSTMVFALIGIIIVAFIVILVLNRAIGTLERLLVNRKDLVVPAEITEGVEVDRFATFKRLIKNKKLVFFVVLAGTVAFGSFSWVTMWNTGVQQGYQPVQPIAYSHELHAGVMKINCQYCHGGAYKSKNASIPSLNVCMNCHKVVKTESKEIQKIYTALGYDPATQKYDTTKARPIQWVRIHNLPDLAYFNHSQHVKVAGLECQNCHGPIQTMKEVYQYSPLTMKWCVQCHKRTNINGLGNAYYDKMVDVHEKLKKGEKVTAAMMGGLECGKCHY
ncbi:c-type cytochrome [Mucilaginibacter terrae]|uniref:Mono/diheme cytochrome c family protein n=1 Tax=Mucilaginibacter terrae TaxID=1955052 RepID=A0ABU3GXF6_9SPHI|nr:c-type cytochrome [Mucilaginibacter terrae]MDT3404439.1 mono/diheme cytochrome c family protein [Mucilaginibacter terrae]